MNPAVIEETPDEAKLREVTNKLQDYFPPECVRFRPIGKPYQNQCEVAAFIDARDVIERLNAVMGLNGWQDEYDTLAAGEVRCRLRLRLGGEWITRTDCGSMSEQPDQGDRCKAAHSDALKRAAVKFGVGLYLYRLKGMYGAHDGKKITQWPTLPSWAIPHDCQPCGKIFAEKLYALVGAAATKAKTNPADVTARLIKRYDYDSKCTLAQVENRHARLMMQEIKEWVELLARPQLPQGQGAGK